MTEKTDDIIELKINCRTWLKETEDLFDFETSNIAEHEFSLTNFDKEYFLLKYKTDTEEKEKIEFINKQNLIKQRINSNDTTKVVSLIKYNKMKSSLNIINSFKARKMNNYKNIYKPEYCERLYELFPLDEYMNINEGDILKIGKVRIKFDKISFKSKDKSIYDMINQETPKDVNNTSIHNNNSKDNFETNNLTSNKIMITSLANSVSGLNADTKTKIICRLCYLSESTITDPLISPCNCNGTMKYIHLSCLKNSIKLKYNKKSSENLEMFIFQNYACEICLTSYPKYIIYKTQVYYLIDIDFNKYENYVLCDLSKYPDNKNKEISHFGYLMFKIEDGEELTFGRKKNNNIKLKDISVSRNHCIITKKGNNLMIKDLGSKFGTMRYIKDNYEMKLKQQTVFLCGKHEIEFCLDKAWNLFSFSDMFNLMCCSCKQPINENAELIMVKEGNNEKENDNDIVEDVSNGELTDKKLIKRVNYLNKFKDNDSYNDYIIKLDYILDNSMINKNNEDNDENENENLNSQIKDKDESFTNY